MRENAQTLDEEIDSEPHEFIQQITKDEGERVGVEQTQFDDVLQTEQIVNSSPTREAHRKTSFPTSSFNQTLTSQQEAFTNKYQPVEVLNS